MLETLKFGAADPAVTCVLLHGRGQSPADMQAMITRHLDVPGVRYVLPKSDGLGWYAARAIDPLADLTRAVCAEALAQVKTVFAAQTGPFVLAGFSQGACLAAEYLLSGAALPAAACLFTGCRVGLPDDRLPQAPLSGLLVYLTGGDSDPWISLDAFHRLHTDLTGEGGRVRTDLFPGRPHTVTGLERSRLQDMLVAVQGAVMRWDDGFVFPGISSRVIFGHGTLAQVGAEVERLGHKKALILSTSHQEPDAQVLAASLGPLASGVFAGAVMHTPTDVTAHAMTAYQVTGADCVVALGGGSTVGLGKAVALRNRADQIVIPTTYAGSEMTDILGQTENGAKTPQRGAAIRPEVVVYDVDLTLSLPPAMTVTSALNAIAHGVEALFATDGSPVLDVMSLDAMPAFRDGLPRVLANPQDRAARAQVLYGAWACSTALGYVSMALHHKLCHVLGGSFGTPHAETHAILIPHTAGFNAVAVPDKLAGVAEIFGSVGPGLWQFAKGLGAPLALRDLGLTADDLDRAAGIAVANPYANPRAFGQADIRALLQAAWEGVCPA